MKRVEDNATPGHCCICGVRNVRSICPDCFERWAVDGKMPDWLRELRNPLQAEAARERRNRERVVRGVKPNARGRGGARHGHFVEMVDIDSVDEGQMWYDGEGSS